MKRILKTIGILLLVVILLAAGYLAYALHGLKRLDDNIVPAVEGTGSEMLPVGETLKAISWNLGFGAYSDDYTFYMDGGEHMRAISRDAVIENIQGDIDVLARENPNLMLLQEVDCAGDRSHFVDEAALITNANPKKSTVYAQNYHAPFILYPLHEPMGRATSGLLTLSDATITSALRRKLPLSDDLGRLLDLDRCFCVSRIPTSNGNTLCLYNLHLSAYGSNPTLKSAQLQMLFDSMVSDYESGCYVIAGGDFNVSFAGESREEFSWAAPFDSSCLPGGFTQAITETAVMSCRNTDIPYIPGETFVTTVDNFIVSPNVQLVRAEVLNEEFAHTDHNPVLIEFILK